MREGTGISQFDGAGIDQLPFGEKIYIAQVAFQR
jgi:hypothetical protein